MKKNIFEMTSISSFIRNLLAVLFIFIFVASAFAAEKQKPKQKLMDNYIAVFDVETVEVDKKLSRPLTESIRRELVMSGKYDVVDRGNMNKILGEQKFQMSGCVSGQCIVEAGQLLGAGKIISGSVSMIGKTYYLTLSLISVETGKIENVSEDECECRVDDLLKSSKRLVKKLLGESVPEPESTKTTTGSSDTRTTSTSPGVIASGAKQSYTDPTTGMEFVLVKGGCYQMGDTFGDGEGDEKPVHEVCVDDFYMGKYEVTQGQWQAVMGNNPSNFKNCGDNCPVEQVSWNDVQEFISRLNEKITPLSPPLSKEGYRLPTEAEWEYAARSGGKSEKYSGGNDVNSVAWYGSNSGSKTHQVGTKAPNGLGLYDMSGNVWEWVQDWKSDNYYSNSPGNNPTGPPSGSFRVRRGGGWDNYGGARRVRVAYRGDGTPYYRDNALGFRLVRTP